MLTRRLCAWICIECSMSFATSRQKSGGYAAACAVRWVPPAWPVRMTCGRLDLEHMPRRPAQRRCSRERSAAPQAATDVRLRHGAPYWQQSNVSYWQPGRRSSRCSLRAFQINDPAGFSMNTGMRSSTHNSITSQEVWKVRFPTRTFAAS